MILFYFKFLNANLKGRKGGTFVVSPGRHLTSLRHCWQPIVFTELKAGFDGGCFTSYIYSLFTCLVVCVLEVTEESQQNTKILRRHEKVL